MSNQTNRYMIAIPCMDMMHTPFVASLTYMRRVGASRVSFVSNSLVYDARNMLAAEAIDTGADRVLWLDSDMQFSSDLMEKLAADMDEGRDLVAGLYFKRKVPVVPVLSKPFSIEDAGDRLVIKGEVYNDYPKDTLFEIGACGFGAVMCSTKLIKSVYDTFDRPFDPMPGMLGEDYAFCYRASKLGFKLWCDSRIKVNHIGQFPYGEKLFELQGGAGND